MSVGRAKTAPPSSAEWGSVPARCTSRVYQKATCQVFGLIIESVSDKSACPRNYVLYFLAFNRKVYPLEEPSVRTHDATLQAAAEMTPGQTLCVWEEVQAVMLIPFFIFLMKPPSCHFRGEEGLTSCADESLLLTGQQAGIESAVWSSCSVNHS